MDEARSSTVDRDFEVSRAILMSRSKCSVTKWRLIVGFVRIAHNIRARDLTVNNEIFQSREVAASQTSQVASSSGSRCVRQTHVNSPIDQMPNHHS